MTVNTPKSGQVLFGVFGYPISGRGIEFLAVYSTPPRAQAFIDAQQRTVRSQLGIAKLTVDSTCARKGLDRHLARSGNEGQARKTVLLLPASARLLRSN
jgi:hypothetical protein